MVLFNLHFHILHRLSITLLLFFLFLSCTLLHLFVNSEASGHGPADQDDDEDEPEVDRHEVARGELVTIGCAGVLPLNLPIAVAHVSSALQLLAGDDAAALRVAPEPAHEVPENGAAGGHTLRRDEG